MAKKKEENSEELAEQLALKMLYMMAVSSMPKNGEDLEADICQLVRLAAGGLKVSLTGKDEADLKAVLPIRASAAATLEAMLPDMRQKMKRRKAFSYGEIISGSKRLYQLWSECWSSAYSRIYGMSTVPSSPAVQALYMVTSAGNRVTELESITRGGSTKVKLSEPDISISSELPNSAAVSVSSGRSDTTIIIPDMADLGRNNRGIKKMLMFVLTQVGRQAISNNILIKDEVSFTLQDLVDSGLYSSVRAARQGFNDFMAYRHNLNVYFSRHEGSVAGERDLFTGSSIKLSVCRVELNYKVNWSELFKFCMLLPNYYYRLSSNAADLLEYVCYLARQSSNNREVAAAGSFTISYKAIQDRLMLSEVGETEHPSRDILDAIDSAVTDIEDVQSKYSSETLLKFEMIDNLEESPAERLEHGRLKIIPCGGLKTALEDTSSRRSKKIASSAKKSNTKSKKCGQTGKSQ